MGGQETPRPETRTAPEPEPRSGLGRGLLLGVGLGLFIVIGAGIGVGAFLYTRDSNDDGSTVAPRAWEPGPGDITPIANERNVRRLHSHFDAHDYEGCLLLSHRVPRTVRVLEITLQCARAGRDVEEARIACRELNRLEPEAPQALHPANTQRRHRRDRVVNPAVAVGQRPQK